MKLSDILLEIKRIGKNEQSFKVPVYRPFEGNVNLTFTERKITFNLNKSGKLEEIKKGDVVYIAGNAKHGLKNNGKETLKFYWIFPTDRFSEVEYFN